MRFLTLPDFASRPFSLYVSPLHSQVDGFRYRVENAMRAVTNANVKEARLRELKMEMLNSHKLKAHFEDNPRELDLLRHDKVLRPAAVQHALASMPSYLIPEIQVQRTHNHTALGR